MAEEGLKFYSSWFCPSAQRVWIALVQKDISFEQVEVDPYKKTADWLAVNPRGKAPALVFKGQSVYESSICLEFLDDQWPQRKIIFGNALERANQRLLGDHVSKEIVPFFGQFFRTGDTTAKDKLIQGIEQLMQHFGSDKFFGGEDLTYVDIMFAPYAMRLETVLGHYRDFQIPDTPIWDKYHNWLEEVENNKSVLATLADKQKLIEFYKRYVG